LPEVKQTENGSRLRSFGSGGRSKGRTVVNTLPHSITQNSKKKGQSEMFHHRQEQSAAIDLNMKG